MAAGKIILPALGFFMLGVASRYTMQHVESRIQIAALWGLAVVAAVLTRRSGPALIANGLAATAAVLLVKFWLEGWPAA